MYQYLVLKNSSIRGICVLVFFGVLGPENLSGENVSNLFGLFAEGVLGEGLKPGLHCEKKDVKKKINKGKHTNWRRRRIYLHFHNMKKL